MGIRMAVRWWRSVFVLALAGLVVSASECHDDDDTDDGFLPPLTPFVLPTPFNVGLSGTGPDQLQSVTAGPAGSFYAAGYTSDDPANPRFVTVVKFLATGALDVSFGGGDGIATTAVEFRGGTGEVGIATQSDGKIIVSATIANTVDPSDRDIAVLRLDSAGTLDTTFGSGLDGVTEIDLNTSLAPPTASDGARGVAVNPTDDTISVLGIQRAEGEISPGVPRTDTDFVVVRLTSAGGVDITFGGGDGEHHLDIDQKDNTPRGIRVMPDGRIIVGGYASTSGVLNKVQPVIYKLTTAGDLDSSFATLGLLHQTVLTEQTEVYNFAVQGGHLVTGGYGRNSGTGPNNVWVSLRVDAESGGRDTGWGGAVNGAVLIDPSSGTLGNNCRNAIALPGGKTLLLGSTGPSNQPTQDAVFAVLTAEGTLDPAYGDGVHVFPLGAVNDAFWGAAVSGDNIIVVGTGGSGAAQTPMANDNAYAVIFPLR